MEYRELGRTGLKVSEISFGSWAIGGTWGNVDDRESIAALHHSLDLGVNFFDTAEVYGPFTNEELVGEALSPLRKDVVISTKFGFDIQDGEIVGLNVRPENIR